MKIFIAYDIKSEPISILLAVDREKADTVWTAAKVYAHNVEEIDPQTIEGMHGFVWLMSSIKLNTRDAGYKGHDYRKWKRGN